ncbi:NAD(P)H-hydrate dehydratase [Sneathiella sp. P13V-1]|uniref:NAD(P)H-hydrate dehydratase n=1 Tax=Sneathiella sp. P13V-1 TaxID=2697366 RepID=UPI001D0FE1FC|nr:NAD(P)H-hydrate dehydratase [Sneathiella sp. P13V-1]
MTELFSVEQMYAADKAAMEGGVPGLTLMENAGQSIVREIEARWAPEPVLVLCGPGNNGGDGYVIARALAEKDWPVRVVVFGDPEKLKGDALEMYRRYTGDIEALAGADNLEDELLIVDAIFGAGFKGDLPEPIRDLFDAISSQGSHVVAVDTPSGVQGTDGTASAGTLEADLTVTFFRPKTGHYLLPGRAYVGELVVTDIGIPEEVLDEIAIDVRQNNPADWFDLIPQPVLDGHKYSRGHLAVNGGGVSSTGAARISARAGLRAGAGAVTVVTPPSALMVYATALEAVMVKSIDSEDDFESWIADRRIGAVIIGPGNGVNDRTRSFVLKALASNADVILDADAITVFQEDPDTLFNAIWEKANGTVVLTPHEAEFARLFDVEGSALERCREAAAKSGAIVLLKGATTVIAAPDGRATLNTNAPPYLATAGSGDALAGIIGGQVIGAEHPFAAVCAAVWIHSEAGAVVGQGLVAEDIEQQIPYIFQKLYVDYS